MNNISVIGLEYADLPTAVLFASKDLKVVGVDINASKVEAINSNRYYLRGPGLAELLCDEVSKGFLRATTNAVGAVRESDAVIVAVPISVRDEVATSLTSGDAPEFVKEVCSPSWSTWFHLRPPQARRALAGEGI
jgi:UDP-N-acetyl-D-mannosaminuronic acid dehydrogenase